MLAFTKFRITILAWTYIVACSTASPHRHEIHHFREETNRIQKRFKLDVKHDINLRKATGEVIPSKLEDPIPAAHALLSVVDQTWRQSECAMGYRGIDYIDYDTGLAIIIRGFNDEESYSTQLQADIANAGLAQLMGDMAAGRPSFSENPDFDVYIGEKEVKWGILKLFALDYSSEKQAALLQNQSFSSLQTMSAASSTDGNGINSTVVTFPRLDSTNLTGAISNPSTHLNSSVPSGNDMSSTANKLGAPSFKFQYTTVRGPNIPPQVAIMMYSLVANAGLYTRYKVESKIENRFNNGDRLVYSRFKGYRIDIVVLGKRRMKHAITYGDVGMALRGALLDLGAREGTVRVAFARRQHPSDFLEIKVSRGEENEDEDEGEVGGSWDGGDVGVNEEQGNGNLTAVSGGAGGRSNTVGGAGTVTVEEVA